MHVGGCGIIGRNVSVITPDLATNILPVATGPNTNGFVFSASAEDTYNQAWKASCHPSGYAIEDKWEVYDAVGSPGTPQWWQVLFPMWVPLCGYALMDGQGCSGPLAWTVSYLDGDGSTWVTADTRTFSEGSIVAWAYRSTYSLATPAVTRGFRINTTSTAWPYRGVSIQQIKIFGGTAT